jgi:pimeloyl-ACP methyl ester carboxylesterase
MRRRTGPVGLALVAIVAVGVTSCAPPSASSETSTTSGSIIKIVPRTPTAAPTGDVTAIVMVGQRTISFECHGTGSPTILLQSGYGNAGDIWKATTAQPPTVAQALATTNRVCVYDRPGSTLSVDPLGNPFPTPQPGRSGPVPQPRTSTDVVTEWHDLMAVLHIPGPYVLVGHSIGGLFALLYARTYPDQVAGLVTVDATPPALLGLLTPTTQTLFRSQLKSQGPITGYAFEQYDIDEILTTLNGAPALKAMPTTLMFAGQAQQVSDPAAQELLKDITRVQDQARAEFAASIPGATTVTVPDASHYIQVDRPDVVIDAVKAVVAKTRRP